MQPTSSYILKSSWSNGQTKVITEIDDKLEKKEEFKAEAEYKKLKAKSESKVDGITKYLKNRDKLHNLVCYNKFTRGDFPLDEKCYRMRVEKYYPTLNLIVDLLPSKKSKEYISARKWMFEQLGYIYIWIMEGEVIKDEAVFWTRAQKLEEKPNYEIKPLIKLF